MAERDTLQTAVEATDQQLEAYLTPTDPGDQKPLGTKLSAAWLRTSLTLGGAAPLAQRLVVERYLLELNELNNPRFAGGWRKAPSMGRRLLTFLFS